jgi:succinoglycan biosynthesis transport protein ExoP
LGYEDAKELTGSRNSKPEAESLSLGEIASFLQRFRVLIATSVAIFIALAALYAFTAEREYTASAKIIIDSPTGQFFKRDLGLGDELFTPDFYESQVELILSDNVAARVVSDLSLDTDPQFNGTAEPGAIRKGINAVKSLWQDQSYVSTPEERKRIAVAVLIGKLAVRRVGSTRVLEISAQLPDKEQAAVLANAVANAYVKDQARARIEAAALGGQWLQEQTTELRRQVELADRAVQDFKQKNNIVGTGGTRLLNEQQLAEINTQLVDAQSQTAQAKARLDRIQTILGSSDVADATVADLIKNPVFTNLRQRYLDAVGRKNSVSSRYGQNHQVVLRLQEEIHELQRSIDDELRQTAETTKSDYEIAKTREETLRAGLERLVGNAGETGHLQVTLRQLESVANTYRATYESFLQRYTGSVQQQSFPMTEVRVITPATPPFEPSHPKTKLLLLAGAAVGLTFGLALAILKNGLDEGIRSATDVSRKLFADCLGIVPRFDKRVASEMSAAARLQHVLISPFAAFSEGLREVKTSLDIVQIARPTQTIGVVSMVPEEGKSTITSNLALLFSAAGKRTLLIDADLRKSTLSALTDQNRPGLVETLMRKYTLSQVAVNLRGSYCDLVTTGAGQLVPNSGDLLSSEAMKALIDEARQTYDIILLDLPPLKAMVDGRAIAPLLDGVVVVVEWGKTPANLVQEGVASLEAAHAQVLGVVLNKADPKESAYQKGYAVSYHA